MKDIVNDANSKVNVYTEFGELKDVIIGSPLGDDDRIYNWTPGMDEEFSWLKPETFDFLKASAGKPWKEANPELWANINSQINAYAETLDKRGINVHRLPALVHEDRNYINGGVEQGWPRDVWCTAGDTVIVSSLRMPWKRKQQFAGLPLYTKLLADGKCTYISAPQASTEVLSPPDRKHAAEETSILLDGGDFFVNGDEVYIGIGHGSNMLGATFAQSVFGDKFKVYPIKLHANALHLDCTMSLLRPGLGLICRKWIVDEELPPGLSGYTWIEVTEEEAFWLGCNGMPLSPETTIIDSRHERVIAEVRKAGHEVIDIPYDAPSYLGGALHCSSQPLVREKA